MFFNREKIIIKTDKKADCIKYFVDYSRLKNKKEFAIKLITDIFQDGLILGVIDTGLMYSTSREGNEKLSESLYELCTKYSIENKVIKTKKEAKGMFGTKVKIGDREKEYDYIFGLILDRKKIENLSDIFNEYNAGFFSAANSNILESFDLDYQDKEFDLSIFNDNYMSRMAVNSKTSKDLENVLEKVKEEFK
ncbi:MAG: hypothetical protein LIR50_13360 [Bacillota bacterium]|nr:hypothetical protein [Bacillota bacterium]